MTATKLPPDLALAALDSQLHELQDAHEAQSMATVVMQFRSLSQTFRSFN
jgi:hypothetical protein